MAETTQPTNRLAGGVPVYAYRRAPGPPVSIVRYESASLPRGHAHAHDFLSLSYFETGGGSLCLDSREWTVRAGDAFVIAPRVVISVGKAALAKATGWVVLFPADVLEPQTAGAFLSWRAHPLLFPFAAGRAGGAQRLTVPPGDRPAWTDRLGALARELAERRDGYPEAAVALLTLLLVDVSRLAADVAGDLTLRDEPLLATVFGVIESRYDQPLSLRDVAAAAGLSPGHLTTIVGRKTGRTVQQWITERRMAEARRLLAGTDLTLAALAGRVGYRDTSYFIKSFKQAHGVTPADWRRAGRP